MVTAMISICALSVDNNSIKCQGATQAPKFAQGWGGTSFSLLLHKKNGSALAVPPPPVITQEKFSWWIRLCLLLWKLWRCYPDAMTAIENLLLDMSWRIALLLTAPLICLRNKRRKYWSAMSGTFPKNQISQELHKFVTDWNSLAARVGDIGLHYVHNEVNIR